MLLRRHICDNPVSSVLSNSILDWLQLEKWEEAVRDYEALRRVLPDDNEVAESLFHAQVALKKSRGEEVHNLKFGGEVEEVSSLDQFRAAISFPGLVKHY